MNLLQEGDNEEKYTTKLINFLKKYDFLFDFSEINENGEYTENTFLIQFLIHDLWEKKMPKEWKEPILSLNITELSNMVTKGEIKENFPESLKQYVSESFKLRLKSYRETNFEKINQDEKNEEYEKLKKLYTRGMSLKKQHEVEKLSELINKISKKTNTKTIIDIGSGKGYLTQVLSYKYDLNVIGIDNNDLNTKNAQKRINNLETQNKKLKLDKNNHISIKKDDNERENKRKNKCIPITTHLDLKITESEFKEVIKPIMSSEEKENTNSLLCGLHTCGDLSSTICKIFLNSPVKALVNVSCCYHKISEKKEKEEYGYTISKFMKKNLKFNLSSSGKILGNK
jgi:hypothetical protein